MNLGNIETTSIQDRDIMMDQFNGQGRSISMASDINPMMMSGMMDTQSMLSSGSSIGIRKDPNLEFFQMCLLCFKINHKSHHEVLEVNYRQLYKKCTEKDKKQFYEFNEWIDKEIKKQRFKKAFEKNRLRQLRKQKLFDLLEIRNGIRYEKDVKILEHYFSF